MAFQAAANATGAVGNLANQALFKNLPVAAFSKGAQSLANGPKNLPTPIMWTAGPLTGSA